MRHDSVRVPQKNFRAFAGRPLYHYVIETLLGCRSVTDVVVDTDSAVIRDGLARDFPRVQVLERPAQLRADTTPMNDVLLNIVRQVEADFYLQTHSTNPLLEAATVERAIAMLAGAYPAHDSLFSVTRLHARLWDELVRPINHNPAILLRTQDLPPVYEENSCLFLFTAEGLQAHRNRIGSRPMLLEMDPREAWDIDELSDFELGEMLYRQRASRGDDCR
jgi:CMP-N-acetylneuraminic acid synthetase